MRFSRDDIQAFADWSGDRNPLHVDEAAARRSVFGRPVVHGMLTAIRTLAATAGGAPLRQLHIDFRSPIFTDALCDLDVSPSPSGLSATLRSAGASALTVRASADAPLVLPDDLSWLSAAMSSGRAAAIPRAVPAEIELETLAPHTEVLGSFRTAPPLAGYTSESFTALHARVLALCSYIIGMELPGLRSLFTRLNLTIFADDVDSSELLFRVRILRFDREFRLLDLQLEVASAGRYVAVAELRSYVRFTPVRAKPEALAALLGDTQHLAGCVALVCGGTRGLGAEISAALAMAGCHVFASYSRDAEAARELKEAIEAAGGTLQLLAGDAADTDWCEGAVQNIRAQHERLDFLVLNACAPPTAMRLGRDPAATFGRYVSDNFALAQVPLAACLPDLSSSGGTVVCISSSFVSQPPDGFGHYVALKEAVEATVRTAVQESTGLGAIIARPPRLQTTWNDTPTGVLGTIAARDAAVQIVRRLSDRAGTAGVDVLSDFPAILPSASPQDPAAAKFNLNVLASFTADPLLAGLQFWFKELDLPGEVTLAPYGQLVQTLLRGGPETSGGRGMDVVLLRISDWLRELAPEQAASSEFVGEFLEAASADFVGAIRAHRMRGNRESLVVVCPSGSDGADIAALLEAREAELLALLDGMPGLAVVRASALHTLYQVAQSDVFDPIREELAHIPFQPAYFHTLATIVMRHVYRRLSPARKVVVVDCDNTLWGGVVGEIGAEGVVFDEGHRALHDALVRLSEAGVLVALCSKNEESDVWRVFDMRSDLALRRHHVVAVEINWLPKSANLRTLAARLNLGLDSFVFIDDNPVECAEVRAGCPEVLTIEWPQEPSRAVRLVRHTWELDPRTATVEDQRRTQLYSEEFRRQELRAQTLTFREFIDSLQLVVEIARLVDADVKRAAQLTLRTNQFNFTTKRRDEAELQRLLDAGAHEIRTVRVRDRFGDYGLVGLLVGERLPSELFADTFLLSCRVLGRGVEHRMAAELGRIATQAGARTVRLRVEPTTRNTPARSFLEEISGSELRQDADGAVQGSIPSAALADLRFEPADAPGIPETLADRAPGSDGALVDVSRLRSRERQITRTALEYSTAAGLLRALGGSQQAGIGISGSDDARTQVLSVFAGALGLTLDHVREVDNLEALGCDSFKIVEITVNLIDRFPGVPPTLLFEHRSVAEIADKIAALTNPRGVPAVEAQALTAPRQSRESSSADIAIVGLHLRTAGADSPERLWTLLSTSSSAVSPVLSQRRYFLGRLDDTRPHWAGLLDEIDRFDTDLFGVTPREAALMDPQLRLFLEVAWSALEDGGCLGDRLEADTGVFAGVMYGDYSYRANVVAKESENPYKCWESFSLANRLSQILGFRGPSLAVDTACSSSATAIHLACRALLAGDCSSAVAGGVNLILDPDRFVQLGRLGILSPTGRCLPFGHEADGTVLGEGAGAVVLRPLAEARRRGDHIYGIIKATGVSTGSGTIGFTAPNPQAQAEAIRRAMRAAGVAPQTVSYVETHGTGTALGDPIEIRGLTLAYADQEMPDVDAGAAHTCAVGSIKPNIGHLEAGAGVLGLIKVLLQMERGMLLPTITSGRPNPQIPFDETPFAVQRTLEPWSRPVIGLKGAAVAVPRRAGLSSFGVGGSNVHIILEEAPPSSPGVDVGIDRPCHILALSARSEESLQRRVTDLASRLDDEASPPLGDVCFSANTGRGVFERRIAVVARGREQMRDRLRQLSDGGESAGAARGAVARSAPPPATAFLFTGQGSQYAGMGKVLYETQPVFRAALDRCTHLFEPLLPVDLTHLMFAEGVGPDAALLDQTANTQPALFAFEYATSELWRSWGVRPDVVIGHSVGEIAAMCVAGGVSLEDAVKLIAARGRLMQALPVGGAMASVMADETRVSEAIAGYRDRLAIAAINGPAHVVISGDGVAVASVSARFSAEGVNTKGLAVSHAFHSPLMAPIVAEYEEVVRSVRFSQPRASFISCVDGRLAGSEITRSEYWVRNLLEPVRFTEGMGALAGRSVKALIEVGPRPVLLGMGRQCLGSRGDDLLWLPSHRKDADSWLTLLGSLGELYVKGATVDWTGFDAPYVRRRVSLPAYPFGGKRHWVGGGVEHARSAQKEPSVSLAYDIVWRNAPPLFEPATSDAPRQWVVVADKNGFGTALADALERCGAQCTIVPAMAATSDIERALRQAGNGSGAAGVVHLGALDAETPSGAVELTLPLLRAVGGENGPNRAVAWIVTKGAAATPQDPTAAPIALAQTPLWGLGRTFALDHPAHWGGLIDVDERMDATLVARELLASDGEDQVALRNGIRYVPRLTRREMESGTQVAIADATYLVTGGTGALGLHAARWLAARGARQIVLTSRRGPAAAGVEPALSDLEALGAKVRVVAADISTPSGISAIFDALAAGPPLRGVIHAAGVDSIGAIGALTAADVHRVMAAKVEGARLLHERTKQLPLDFFVCFSSIASVVGAAGRALYASANAYLDGLAHERRRMGCVALTINWGPWAGGGMAADGAAEQFERIGNRAIDPARALRTLEQVLGIEQAQIAVADINWELFSGAYQARRSRPLIAEVEPSHSARAVPRASAWVDRLQAIHPDNRTAELVALLRAEAAKTLGFSSADDVDTDRTFYEVGMDSLTTADFAQRIQKHLGLPSTRLVFEYASIDRLAARLAATLPLGDASRGPASVETPAAAEPVRSASDRWIDAGTVEDEILAFQRVAFPSRRPDWIAARWRWMVGDSARRLGVAPQAWFHRDSGTIVGQNVAMPVRLKVGEHEHLTAWLVDTMVLDQYRSQAVGARLMVEAHDALPFALSLGQTEQMREIQFRLGWKLVTPLQNAQLLLRPERVLAGKLPGPIALAAGLGLRARSVIRAASMSSNVGDVREVARFDSSHDELWRRMASHLTCAVRRDASYLNWKYVDQPGQEFLRLELTADGRSRGLVVCMFRAPDEAYGYHRAFIVDLVGPLADARLLDDLIRVAIDAAARRGADLVQCLHVSPPLTAALRRHGFSVRAPSRHLLVRPGPLNQEETRTVLAAETWFVTHGDSDIDRPW